MVRGAGSRKGKESDMYTFDSRVRYSETDEEGNLSGETEVKTGTFGWNNG